MKIIDDVEATPLFVAIVTGLAGSSYSKVYGLTAAGQVFAWTNVYNTPDTPHPMKTHTEWVLCATQKVVPS